MVKVSRPLPLNYRATLTIIVLHFYLALLILNVFLCWIRAVRSKFLIWNNPPCQTTQPRVLAAKIHKDNYGIHFHTSKHHLNII